MNNKRITSPIKSEEQKYHGLRNAIIKQAADDLKRTLKRFFKDPESTKNELNTMYRYFIANHCYNMVSDGAAEYIYYETVKEVESLYTEEDIKKAREIFKYYHD